VKPDGSRTPEGSRRPPAGRRHKRGPLVSVLLPTHNRPRYLAEALASVVRQTYDNLEIFVIRDGGAEVTDVVRSFGDARVILLDRSENRGKPFALNEALARARGRYIAYLDDDDMYYPFHIAVLVEALESGTDGGVAYSDLYKTYCQVLAGGGRVVRSKHVEISRDFDRFLMLYFNHVLHVSLMHRRDLLERTGLYNENLSVLIDWDMTRRLAFFSDFRHVPVVTGEFYSPLGDCDRISVQQRKNQQEYERNVRTIRTTRPPKPWPKNKDLSIILLAERADGRLAETLHRIWQYTFYPYKLHLPLPAPGLSRLNVEMPNVELVPVPPHAAAAERLDAALRRSEGDFVAVVPVDLPLREMWVENPLFALLHSTRPEGFFLAEAAPPSEAIVLARGDLERARKAHPHLSLTASLTAAGLRVRRPGAAELPFQFDEMLREAKLAEAEGQWAPAARLYECMAARFGNTLWMKAVAARACFEAGDHGQASRLSRAVNHERPTVDTLLLEARIQRLRRDFPAAIGLLGQAEQLLDDPAGAAAPPAGHLCLK
jgi:glycosyltransferase involved in cell wall biosynthesis